jgi:predicted PurR-regulated permease PerM
MNLSKFEARMLDSRRVTELLWIGIIVVASLVVIVPFGLYSAQQIDNIWKSNENEIENIKANTGKVEKVLIDVVESQNKTVRETMKQLFNEIILRSVLVLVFVGAAFIVLYFRSKAYLNIIRKYQEAEHTGSIKDQ